MITSADLPQAGNSGDYLESAMVPCLVDLGFVGKRGPGSDEAHVATNDVDNLREFVQAKAPQNPAQRGNPVVVGQLVEVRPVVLGCGTLGPNPLSDVLPMLRVARGDPHGAELEHLEWFPADSYPDLAKQNRGAIEEPHGQRGESKDR